MTLNNVLKDVFANSSHEFFVYVSADDIQVKNRFGLQVDALEKNPGTLGVGGFVSRDGVKVLSSATLMFKRSAFEKFGYYFPSRFGSDTDHMKRFGKEEITWLDQVLHLYVNSRNQLTQVYQFDDRDYFTSRITIKNKHCKSKFQPYPWRTGHVATFSKRLSSLQSTINSIVDQLDHVVVYINDLDYIPDFLQHSKKITVHVHPAGDLKDVGKFYDIRPGYNLTFDDDLYYSKNYVLDTISKLGAYDNRIIATYHGRVMNNNVNSYYTGCSKYVSCLKCLPQDLEVNVPGTGVMAWHSDAIEFDYKEMKPLMVDLSVGVQALEKNVPVIALRHDPGLVRDIVSENEYKGGIWHDQHERDSEQTKLSNSVTWKLTGVQTIEFMDTTESYIKEKARKKLEKWRRKQNLQGYVYVRFKENRTPVYCKKLAVDRLLRTGLADIISHEEYVAIMEESKELKVEILTK
jgi:hypothetical protein